MSALRQQFGDDFAGSAFTRHNGEEFIVGKFGDITQMDDGSYDVWFVGKGGEPLTEHKISAICKKLPQQSKAHRLDGEMWVQGRGRDFVLKLAPLVGIKKKRRLSDEAKQAMRDRLAQIRNSGVVNQNR